MDAIYSATALRDHPREVKRAAQERLVERALYVQRAEAAIDAGRRAFEAGDYIEGIDAARQAVAERRASRG